MPRTDPPLRILHFFRAPVGGLFRHVRDLAEAQHRGGHHVGLVCDSSTGGDPAATALERIAPALDLGLTRLPMQRRPSPSDLPALMGLFRSVRKLDPDVIHAHGAKGGVFGRSVGTLLRVSGSRVARIYSPHGGSLHFDPGSLTGRAYLTAERALQRLTDALIFVSEYEAQVYAEKVGRIVRPFEIVRNGLRPEEFEPVPAGPGARDFLFIGELRDLKGPDVFLLALSRLRRASAPVTGCVVGAGPDRDRYVAMARELGLGDRIEFRDAMPARQAFALARSVVVPSRAESMPYIVLEATAAGKPLVATSVGGIPEIFGPESSRLVPPGDAEALAVAMERIVVDPASAEAAAAGLREQIRGAFSVDAMAAAVLATYRRVTIPAG